MTDNEIDNKQRAEIENLISQSSKLNAETTAIHAKLKYYPWLVIGLPLALLALKSLIEMLAKPAVG